MPRRADIVAWASRPFLGNPTWAWCAAALAALLAFAVLLLARRLLVRRAGAPAGTAPALANLFVRTHPLFLLAVSVFLASLLLRLGPAGETLRRVLTAVALVQSGVWGNVLIRVVLVRWSERRGESGIVPPTLAIAGVLARIAVWTVVLLLALDNLGVRITALLAGVGIGGIAVALALQNILGDVFASVSILLDRPFEVGDFLVTGDVLGTVERIGLKTTRIRSLSGEQVVVANADLLASRIRNFKRMSERRVVFSVGITYGTPPERVEEVPAILRGIVERAAPGRLRFDRAHFQKFGDFALVYEVVYHVLSPDYNAYMDIQQAINLGVYREFAEKRIEFAYPTQTIVLAGAAAGARGN
ncbi:MAG: mechanosensitive ion channel family protein [Planctomycetia bacterium]|nr:mechanosensitive ion channel family protein [Planctomycetia bacterium]